MTILTAVACQAANNAVVDLLDGGKFQLMTSGYGAVLSEHTFTNNPAATSASLATPSDSTIAINNATGSTNAGTGTAAAAYRFLNSADAVIFQNTGSGAVGTTGSGAEVILNQSATTIVSGQSVTIASPFTYRQPAS